MHGHRQEMLGFENDGESNLEAAFDCPTTRVNENRAAMESGSGCHTVAKSGQANSASPQPVPTPCSSRLRFRVFRILTSTRRFWRRVVVVVKLPTPPIRRCHIQTLLAGGEHPSSWRLRHPPLVVPARLARPVRVVFRRVNQIPEIQPTAQVGRVCPRDSDPQAAVLLFKSGVGDAWMMRLERGAEPAKQAFPSVASVDFSGMPEVGEERWKVGCETITDASLARGHSSIQDLASHL
ncbi:unnamed protein product [Mycena citricolor]|uniref:Uncharacterized protein n=1 Tax=Mycena citricolor TaxID=2018698 RepID=A0AAD2K469_9AGAR|nr:unnamed protein product [Mycena citricolor]